MNKYKYDFDKQCFSFTQLNIFQYWNLKININFMQNMESIKKLTTN